MFTADQTTALNAPLDPKNVKPPAPGKYGEYIEGWKVIEEANRIFGFDGWSRETIENVEVCRYEAKVGRDQKDGWAVGYRAKVRVTIFAGDREIVREGSAVGNGVSVQLYDAIESAAKEAETDAMKRAMMTLGYPFGLALYDKTKANVQAPVEHITDEQRGELITLCETAGVNSLTVCDTYGVKDFRDLAPAQFEAARKRLNLSIDKKIQQKEAA